MPVRISKEFIEKLRPDGGRHAYRDAACPGLVLRVGASGRATWAYDYRDPQGRRQTFTIGDARKISPGDARKRVKKLGDDPAAEKRTQRETTRRAASRTIKALLDGRYWTDHLAHRKSGLATKKRIQAAWEPFLEVDLERLDPDKLAKHRAKRLAAGVTPQTLNRDRTALVALVNKAVEWNLLDQNPLAGKKFPRATTSLDRRVRWLGQRDEHEDIKDAASGEKIGERQRFMRALDGAPAYLRRLVIFAMNTGLRRGEIFKLRWSAVSLTRRQVTVHAATAKTDRTRHIPLNDAALVVLQQLADGRPEGASADALVFASPVRPKNKRNAEKPLDNVKRSWQSLIEKAQITDFRFHDLRHDYASRLVQAGVPLVVVRDLLGHTTIQLTERYAHLEDRAKHDAVGLLVGAQGA